MNWHAFFVVAAISLVTAAARFLPFLLFRDGVGGSPRLQRLMSALPYAIMAVLVVYCLRSLEFDRAAAYLPTLLSVLVTAVLHIKKGNVLLSILGGTLCNMLLTQLVFAA